MKLNDQFSGQPPILLSDEFVRYLKGLQVWNIRFKSGLSVISEVVDVSDEKMETYGTMFVKPVSGGAFEVEKITLEESTFLLESIELASEIPPIAKLCYLKIKTRELLKQLGGLDIPASDIDSDDIKLTWSIGEFVTFLDIVQKPSLN